MNVAIIGAGVLGRLLALQLIENNCTVTIFDKDELNAPNNAASTSAGMLCPLGEIIHAPPVVAEKGWWSLERWPSILQKLTGMDEEKESVFFQQEGSLALAFPQDKACFQQLQQDMNLKVKDADAVAWLNKSELTSLEPSLQTFTQGVHLKSEGQLCNRTFLRVSARVLKERCEVKEKKEITEQEIEDLQNTFDFVFDCRGSGAIEKPLYESQQPLRGVRGEVARVYCPEVSLSRPLRIIHPRNSIYIVPKPNHEFVIGATEVETHSEHPITVRSTLELLSTLYSVHPGFAEAQVLETNVGIRTAYADNIPTVSQHGNLITMNGCYRHGWLVGPAVVQDALELLEAA